MFGDDQGLVISKLRDLVHVWEIFWNENLFMDFFEKYFIIIVKYLISSIHFNVHPF